MRQSISGLIAQAKSDLAIAIDEEQSAKELLANAQMKRQTLEAFLRQIESYGTGLSRKEEPKMRPINPDSKEGVITKRVVGFLKAANGKPLSSRQLFDLLDSTPDGTLIHSKQDNNGLSARLGVFSAHLSRILVAPDSPIMRRGGRRGDFVLKHSGNVKQ